MRARRPGFHPRLPSPVGRTNRSPPALRTATSWLDDDRRWLHREARAVHGILRLPLALSFASLLTTRTQRRFRYSEAFRGAGSPRCTLVRSEFNRCLFGSVWRWSCLTNVGEWAQT